jgi:HK97 gp10 family phage protein
MQVTGLHETTEALKAMSRKAAKQDVRVALRAGAGVIAKIAQSIAPKKTGLMARAVVVRGGRPGNKGRVSATITYNKKIFPKQFYGDYADQGHYTGKRIAKSVMKLASKSVNWSSDRETRGGQNRALYAALSRSKGRKHIEGSHTLELAYNTGKERAVEVFGETLGEMVEER